MAGISVKLPLERDAQDGYAINKTTLEAVKQNLKMVVLTSPGERVMEPTFGVGLKRFLFELANEHTYDNIRTTITSQVGTWLPFIKILGIAIRGPDDNTFISSGVPLSIQIQYTVPGLNTADILEISMPETT